MDFGSIVSFVSNTTTTTSAAASRPFTAAFSLTLLGRLASESQLAVAGDPRGKPLPAGQGRCSAAPQAKERP